MRTAHCILPLSIVVAQVLCVAQTPPKSDAQLDGLSGPVKTVSTTATHAQVDWHQPDGPTLVLPIFCWECDYDLDGARTRTGQIVDGKNFGGEEILLDRDSSGHIFDRKVFDRSTGALSRHEIVGPFGKTSETDYLDGKLFSQQSISYDQYGHISSWTTLDPTGSETSQQVIRTTKDGVVTETSGSQKSPHLRWRQTFEPETKFEQFTTWDAAGVVKLTWTFQLGKILAFKQQPDAESTRQFGDSFTEPQDNGDQKTYDCRQGLPCKEGVVHYDFLSPGRRNPKSVEWRDAEGNLLVAAYFEYALDSFQNWTQRKVFVWSPELGSKTRYEEDSRIISYWPH